MAFELKQNLKLSQQLVMTPQLQQAIKLLQLSRLELSDLIRQEIDENPVLDEKLESESGEQETEKDELAASNESTDDLPEVKNENEFDWKDFVDNSINPSTGSYSAGGEDREQYDSLATKPDTFIDHLFWQLRLHDLNDKEMEVGEYIIGNLNRDGYLKASLEEVASATGVEIELVEKVRSKIKSFDF